jgi:hypothetical protein
MNVFPSHPRRQPHPEFHHSLKALVSFFPARPSVSLLKQLASNCFTTFAFHPPNLASNCFYVMLRDFGREKVRKGLSYWPLDSRSGRE